MQEEWEVELTKLTAKFEKDLQTKARNKEDQKVLTLKYAKEKDKFEIVEEKFPSAEHPWLFLAYGAFVLSHTKENNPDLKLPEFFLVEVKMKKILHIGDFTNFIICKEVCNM